MSARGRLERLLGLRDLTLLGVGGVVGSGVFVVTGEAAAHHAGPAVVVSFVLGALAAALAGLCYAEMASMVDEGGSAYSYVRRTLGEVPAFLVGWNLILEYGVAAACTAVGWSKYAAGLVEGVSGRALPWAWAHAPLEMVEGTGRLAWSGARANLPAAGVIVLVAGVLLLGLKWSVAATRVVVGIKLAVIALFIARTLPHARLANLTPFVPANDGTFGAFGASGVAQAGTMLFFTYCGFDAISTAAGECRRPQRDVPRAMLISLAVAAALYVGVALVLCAAVPYAELGVADPLARGMRAAGGGWAVGLVQVGALVGLTSVMLVQIFGQTRILYAICGDGLLPRRWARLGAGRGVPARLTVGVAAGAATLGALLPARLLGELTSMGTLLAFAMVAVGVMHLRRRDPDRRRSFRVPGPGWALPGLTVAVAVGLLAVGQATSLWRLCVWTCLGLAVLIVRRRPGGDAARLEVPARALRPGAGEHGDEPPPR